MSRDPTSWLGTLEPEKPRNARSWDGSTGDPEITPVGEIQKTSRKQPVSTFSVGQSTERPTKKAAPAVAEETQMPKGMPIAPKRNAVSDVERVARRDRLRSYLETNGPTTREALRSALGYGHESAGKQLLNKDLEHLGAKGIPGEAVSLPGQGAGPVAPPVPSGAGFFPMAPPSPSDINAVIDRRTAERVEAEKAQGLVDALDAALTAFAEASIDLDKALDRHAKARAAVLAAAEEKRPR